jgi:heat-inducible transcriptional repressor
MPRNNQSSQAVANLRGFFRAAGTALRQRFSTIDDVTIERVGSSVPGALSGTFPAAGGRADWPKIDQEFEMELSRRAFSVLCAVVELHIRSGDPVASKQVARHSGLGLSPATIRNVMAELEEGGFLCRAHSSAGRVPSDRGFRCYVDTLPRRSGPTPTMRREIEERMAAMRRELFEDVEWVARLIAEATSEAGVAVRPMGDGPVLEAISLVLLDNNRVLGVVVTDDGAVEKRVLELDGDLTRERLQTFSNFLISHLAGLSMRNVESRIETLYPGEGNAGPGGMQAEALDIARQLFSIEDRDVEVWVAGTDNLLATSDFVDIERVRSLLTTLQDRARIAKEFRKAFSRGRTQVLIGEESEATASGSLGMVATLYFRDSRRAGAVGVVGPRRMDYQRIVPVVEHVGNTLTQMLETPGASNA